MTDLVEKMDQALHELGQNCTCSTVHQIRHHRRKVIRAVLDAEIPGIVVGVIGEDDNLSNTELPSGRPAMLCCNSILYGASTSKDGTLSWFTAALRKQMMGGE